MARTCLECRRPRVNLARPSTFARFLRIYETLEELGGTVETQAELLRVLWKRFRIAHGTAQNLIDAGATRGHFVVEYHGTWPLKKRILAARRPEPGEFQGAICPGCGSVAGPEGSPEVPAHQPERRKPRPGRIVYGGRDWRRR